MAILDRSLRTVQRLDIDSCGLHFDPARDRLYVADIHANAIVAFDAMTWDVLGSTDSPAVAQERLTLTAQGHVRYRLKSPYRDGTTQVVLLRASCPTPFGASLRLFKIAPGDFVEPLDFLARLAALVPPPRASDALPRRVRPACGAARGDHAGGAGARSPE